MFRFMLMTGSVKNHLMYYIYHSLLGKLPNDRLNTGRKKIIPTNTYWHFSVALSLLGVIPTGIAATPWTYQCSIENSMSTYTSSWYNTVNPTHFEFRLLATTREMNATDNQGIDSNALLRNVEALKNSLYDLGQIQFNNTSATVTVYGAALYGDKHDFSGYGVQSPESTRPDLINYFLNCSAYTDCIGILTPVNGVLNFQINNKLSFSSAFSSPQLSLPLNLPEGPKNEYQSHSITFTDTLLAVGYDISSPVGINLGPGSYYPAPSQASLSRITCNREATPLIVTLNDGSPVISFGTVLLRQDPVVRPLTWKTSGSGQADIWTLTYDSPTKTGDTLLLGDVMITIQDELGNIIPLGSPVTIRGTSGEHTLILDPKTDMTGLQSTNLNVTLTAN